MENKMIGRSVFVACFLASLAASQRYLQLRADAEKHALSLLEQTMEEEREWRRANPETAPARESAAAPASPPVKVAAVPAKPPPATSVPPAAVAPTPVFRCRVCFVSHVSGASGDRHLGIAAEDKNTQTRGEEIEGRIAGAQASQLGVGLHQPPPGLELLESPIPTEEVSK
jgi:hypothetical protein